MSQIQGFPHVKYEWKICSKLSLRVVLNILTWWLSLKEWAILPLHRQLNNWWGWWKIATFFFTVLKLFLLSVHGMRRVYFGINYSEVLNCLNDNCIDIWCENFQNKMQGIVKICAQKQEQKKWDRVENYSQMGFITKEKNESTKGGWLPTWTEWPSGRSTVLQHFPKLI